MSKIQQLVFLRGVKLLNPHTNKKNILIQDHENKNNKKQFVDIVTNKQVNLFSSCKGKCMWCSTDVNETHPFRIMCMEDINKNIIYVYGFYCTINCLMAEIYDNDKKIKEYRNPYYSDNANCIKQTISFYNPQIKCNRFNDVCICPSIHKCKKSEYIYGDVKNDLFYKCFIN